MKIAYLINQYPKVSHSFIRREILALEKLGFEVARIALRGWQESLPDQADQAELKRTRYVLRAGAAVLLGSFLLQVLSSPLRLFRAARISAKMAGKSNRSSFYNLIYLLEACVVARWLLTSEARHIHAHFGTNSAEVAMLAGVLANVPYSFTAHGPEEFDRPDTLGLAEKIARAAFVVAISSFGRAQLFRWTDGGQWSKVHVVHCGLDGLYLDAIEDSPAKAGRLVCVGRLCEQKGQLLLVEALRRTIDAGGQCEIVFAGDGDFRHFLETRIRELRLQNHVRITGWISGSQVREEIRQARALVLPSFAEGLPVVIMEAMAMRRPVISTYVAGIPELVSGAECGWLVPAGDVGALSDAILACLEARPEELKKMGQLSRERVLNRHDINSEAAVLGSLFRAEAGIASEGIRLPRRPPHVQDGVERLR